MQARSKAGAPRRRLVALVIAGATLAGLVSAVAGGPPAGAQAPPKPEAASPEAALATAAGRGGRVVEADAGGPVTFVGTPPGGSIALADPGTGPRSSAQAFVEQFGAAFGEDQAARDLTVDRATTMGAGGKAVHYQQLEGGVPVLAGELNVQVTASGRVRSAGGELSTGAAIDTAPDVAAATATETALAAVAADAGVSVELLTAEEPALWVYDPALIDNPGGRVLVWQVDVSSDTVVVHERVLVDAHSGSVVLRLERAPEAKNRQVCDSNNVGNAGYTCPSASAPLARAEGGAASLVADVNAAYDGSGATYDFYKTSFNRDSIDGAGMTIRSTVRSCPNNAVYGCPMQNAFWDGGNAATGHMVYGQGFAAADDVVGHELTHGVTQFESNLVYANQSGAINESLSDVFGEFIDQVNGLGTDTPAVKWEMGEDVPGFGAIRDMEDPGRAPFGDPDRMGSPNYYTGSADSGGVHTNSGVNNKAAFLMTDGQTFNGVQVTGLGITKVARIYYEAQVNLLTSGSDYAALPQACNNLVGVVGITGADCQEVIDAVTATEMVVPPPANDNLANATTISGTSGTTTGSTSAATRQAGEPCHGQVTQTSCGNFAGTASVWYQFTAAGSGTATLTTCNSGYDTLLAAYTGTVVSSLTQVASNDDNGIGACASTLHSRIQFSVTQGTTYRVAVDGYGSLKGAVTLNWTLPAAPAPTGISGTVTETGTNAPVGGAMVAVLRSSDFSVAGGARADGSGNYSVLVPAGDYHLYVIDPSGAHVTGFFGPPTLVTVVNGSMVDRDPTMAPTRGTIAGTVSTDSPVGTLGGAWALAVDATTGAVGVGTVANGSGQYSLGNLPARNHWAVFLDPTGAHRSEFFPNSSDAAGATAIAVSGGGTSSANVSLANQTQVGTGQSLSGTVTDAGTGTPLVGMWVFALRASDFTMARSAVTNANGQYSLNVAAGAYKIGFIDPTALHAMEWFNNQPGNALATSTTVQAPQVVDAGLAPLTGSVSGTVTDDVTNAAVNDAWVFAIDTTGKIAGGAFTANGSYTISGLPAGAYRVTFVDAVGGRNQEYFDNSATYGGAVVLNVTGGGTVNASAALHHP